LQSFANGSGQFRAGAQEALERESSEAKYCGTRKKPEQRKQTFLRQFLQSLYTAQQDVRVAVSLSIAGRRGDAIPVSMLD